MHYNKFSRRYFLKGAAASLMLPYLPSIMPRAYAAGEPATRYIQMISSHGQYAQHFYPSDSGLVAQSGSGIFARPLSSISGDISRVIGTELSVYKNKISILRGMHVLAGSVNHNGSMPTCSSGTPEDAYGNGRPVFPYSIDVVLSEAAKIYPNSSGIQKLINLCPYNSSSVPASGYPSYSWNKISGSVQHTSYTATTNSLLSKFMQLGTTPAVDPTQTRKVDVIQGVYDDYKAIRDSGKLSSEDRIRFESYMSLIDEVQRDLTSVAPVALCTKPTPESEPNLDAIHRNQANILVAAMACQLTRVCSYVLTIPYSPNHDYSHDATLSTSHADSQRMLGKRVAYLMAQMDKIAEVGGTLFDNSIVYWGNEFGENKNSGGAADAHRPDNMTALVAGGAAGKLQLGQYIDYRKTGGVPFNNFLISLFNAMGLSSMDYQRDGIIGFGEYNSSAISSRKLESKTTSAERIKPLPYFYKGPILG